MASRDRGWRALPAAALALVPLLCAADEPESLALAPGLERMEELSAKGETEEALAIGEALLRPDAFTSWRRDLELEGSTVIAPALDLAEPVLEWLGLTGRTAEQRAAVHYALGVALLAAEDPAKAKEAFGEARALAGRGGLRLDSAYNLGTVVLEEGEEAFARIPEVAAARGQAPPQPPSAPAVPAGPPGPGGAAPAAEPEDPLQVARALYLEAKELLVDRLRLDWRDPDTRANVELVMRRLRQLDELQRQREQQKQDQQQQDQDQDQDQGKPEDQQGQQDQQKPEDQKGEEEKQDQQPPDQQRGEQDDQEGEVQERYLTEEEVQRLLDMLERYEEEGKQVLEQRLQGQRRSTKRDW